MSTLSAIIAARNEESNIAAAVESLAAQPEVLEILVVNDHSTDGTARVLGALAARVPRLRVLDAAELPPGWMGKSHASWQGAREARGDWLLFSDADVTHLPGSAARALSDAAETGAALVSYSPEQETRAVWERAVIPFVFTRLAQLYPFASVNDAASPVAAANGQYLLIRREVYQAIGGHAAVRGEVLEDVALATRVKAAGHRLRFAPGPGIARTRMYATFGAMWQGWTKNLYPLVMRAPAGGPRAFARELAQAWCWAALPFFYFPALSWIGVLLWLAGHLHYSRRLAGIGGPPQSVIYYVPASLLYALLLAGSAARYRAGKVVWKGREYPVESR